MNKYQTILKFKMTKIKMEVVINNAQTLKIQRTKLKIKIIIMMSKIKVQLEKVLRKPLLYLLKNY